MFCCSLFIRLTPVVFLASEARADDATVFVGPGGTMQFSPSTVGINVGETVLWKWNATGYTYHSVHSGTPAQPNSLFDSGLQGGTATFSHRFTTAGTFPYFCQVHTTMMTGTVLVTGPSPTPTPGGAPSTLGNIATRLRVQSGDNALIGGLIATGTASKRVIIRAIGPSLIPFGVSGALANPTLDLFQGSTLLFSNDDWNNSTQQAEIAASGLAPSNNLESAIIQTLTPGQNYTAAVRGANGTTGIGIVEAFDLDQAAASKLGNISTRGFVDVDDNVMIAGLIAGPSNGTSLKVLVRALGPTLSDFGVAGALANPTLDLVNSSGVVIRSNDNWKDDSQQRAQIEAAGLAPAHDEESALVETVAPGAYTAVVRGSGRTTGIGLVEAYNIP
jgi:plastocyanin